MTSPGEEMRDQLIDLLSDWFESVPGFSDSGEGTIRGTVRDARRRIANG